MHRLRSEPELLSAHILVVYVPVLCLSVQNAMRYGDSESGKCRVSKHYVKCNTVSRKKEENNWPHRKYYNLDVGQDIDEHTIKSINDLTNGSNNANKTNK